MYRKYYLVEVILLLLLSHGGWNGPSVTFLKCTSESSRLIRNVVQKQLQPVVSRYGVTLPFECPLHARRDMFWWLQTDGMDIYKCPICGQKFRCENNFVTHWTASHAAAYGMSGETVCLDDYCDVFRCDVLRQKELLAKIKDNKASSESSENPKLEKKVEKECHPKDMTFLRHKCRSVIRQCTLGLIASLSSKDFQDLEDDLDEALCSYLTCDKYWNDFSSQLHFVPTIICIMIALLVFTGFCVCYYCVWLLFDKNSNEQLCCKCRKPRPHSRLRKEKTLYQTHKSIHPRENGQVYGI